MTQQAYLVLTVWPAQAHSSIFREGPQQGDLWLSDLPPGQGAGDGARTHDRRIPADIRADLLATVPPTPRRGQEEKEGRRKDNMELGNGEKVRGQGGKLGRRKEERTRKKMAEMEDAEVKYMDKTEDTIGEGSLNRHRLNLNQNCPR
ncbi:hypothetical protein PoB_001467400 [Plakobranchus ocellatus]|uniref:Uncharacterized protein n=1 Tax=Plakobranchus ocellatus TaxID=259542 RepID=A0AAV3YYR0_9GAST|nr:hypothetical protein PoB_001467400 [Plakobranchus ocellatus]